MIIDCHTYTWESLDQLGRCLPGTGRPTTAADAAAPVSSRSVSVLQAGISRHLAAAEPVDRSIVLGFKSRYLGADIPNERVAAYVHDHNDRLIGFAGIDPSTPREAVADLKSAKEELFMRGAAVAPAAQDFHPSSSHAMSVYAEVERLGLPILFHTGPFMTPATRLDFARPFLLDEVAREFPNLKIVIAHLGYPWVEETIVLLGKHPNLFADISRLLHRPWMAYQSLLSAFQHGVMDRLLFGSGFPFSTPAQCIEDLYSINHLVHGTGLPTIPREQLRGIVQRDTLSLLGLASPAAAPSMIPANAVDQFDLEHETI